MSKNPIDKLSGLAVVTGGTSGIGLELAKRAARDGCEVILVARSRDAAAINQVEASGASSVEMIEADLSTEHGVDTLMAALKDRPVAALFANAGMGQGGAFLDQDWREIASAIDLNIKGTLSLIHQVGRQMRTRGVGRILVTGSIVGEMPGPYNLTYNSTKAFINDFCVGLANELKESELTVTVLEPGATDTAFFERADMEGGGVGDAPKAPPSKPANDGYDAMLKGETIEVSGVLNKFQATMGKLLPEKLVAEIHRHMAKPAVEKG